MTSLQRWIFNFKTKMSDNTKRTKKSYLPWNRLFCETQPMCELHLFTLYIYDQNTIIQMFVVVFWSFILLCVVLQLYWAMMCVNACICAVSFMHAFLAVYDQAFPCPIYTQSRAYWVWARCTNDGKYSQSKRFNSMTPVLQVEITNH